MILVTKTSDQTRQRGHTLSVCVCVFTKLHITAQVCVCVCVCVYVRFILGLTDRASAIPSNIRGCQSGTVHSSYLLIVTKTYCRKVDGPHRVMITTRYVL